LSDSDAQSLKQPSSQENNIILYEQVHLLFKSLPLATVGSFITASILTYIQWFSIPHYLLITWLSIIAVLSCARFATYIAFRKAKPDPVHIKPWATMHARLTVALAFAWGSAGIIHFPSGDFVHIAGTTLIIAGIAAASTPSYAPLKLPAIIFLSCLLIPLGINLILDTHELSLPFGIVIWMYLFYLISTTRILSHSVSQNISLRLQSINREKRIKISQALVKENSDVLEMIAKGLPADEIYSAITNLYESRDSELICCILELRGGSLHPVGKTKLSPAYLSAIDGLKPGLNEGSCGTSTFIGERVLVGSIATDPKWKKYKDLALTDNLQCCWSEPVKDGLGHVLGSIGMYYHHQGLPTESQLHDLENAAWLIGIVMERQHREDLLQKLYSAFEYAPNAIMITDINAKLEYVNHTFEAMTGYKKEEIIGQFLKILRSDKHSDSFYEKLSDNDKSGKTSQVELTIKCKDGSFLDVHRSVSPVFNDQGEILFLVVSQEDLSEKKELQAQFQQAQKMNAIGTLVGGIAHDFNNILAGMGGNVYLAKQATAHMPDVQQKLTSVEALSFRAADLIQQLLTFARKDHVQTKPLPLLPFFDEYMSFVKSVIPQNISLGFKHSELPISIEGNATQLQQVLLNLTTNARDAVAHVANPEIKVELDLFQPDESFLQIHPYFKSCSYAHFSVKDNGTGISKSQQQYIYEPFFTSKDPGKGTGLGLSMAFGAVKTHNGFLELDSMEHKGSTFHIYIPTIKADTLESTSASETPSKHGDGECILVVDDEIDVLRTSVEVLETLGYRVLQASDGIAAIEVFESNQDDIALVITDVVMPWLGGVEAITRMREIKPNIKVIFTTGYDRSTALTTQDIGESESVLTKPVMIEKLSDLISEKLTLEKS